MQRYCNPLDNPYIKHKLEADEIDQ